MGNDGVFLFRFLCISECGAVNFDRDLLREPNR